MLMRPQGIIALIKTSKLIFTLQASRAVHTKNKNNDDVKIHSDKHCCTYSAHAVALPLALFCCHIYMMVCVHAESGVVVK